MRLFRKAGSAVGAARSTPMLSRRHGLKTSETINSTNPDVDLFWKRRHTYQRYKQDTYTISRRKAVFRYSKYFVWQRLFCGLSSVKNKVHKIFLCGYESMSEKNRSTNETALSYLGVLHWFVSFIESVVSVACFIIKTTAQSFMKAIVLQYLSTCSFS